MNRNLLFSMYFLSLSMMSCSGKLEKKEYVQWVQSYENDLHQKVSCGNYVMDVQYQPADYVLLQRTQGKIDKNEIDVLRKEISGLQYYLLTIEVKDRKGDVIKYGTTNGSEVQERLYYYSYQFQNDIHLEENGIESPCALFHFVRPVDLSTSRTFVVGFENHDSSESTLIVKSPYLGSVPVKIKMLKDNIPTLQI